ncbi:hypothetical protein EDC01DRAFT_440395 [Geopyxis carbonaria]|nr:hypothetical protein EDC01DRAFT_440395 [Geopyxis carbonaria]
MITPHLPTPANLQSPRKPQVSSPRVCNLHYTPEAYQHHPRRLSPQPPHTSPPLNTTMATWSDLPLELVFEIATHLFWQSPRALHMLLLTEVRLYTGYERYLRRRLERELFEEYLFLRVNFYNISCTFGRPGHRFGMERMEGRIDPRRARARLAFMKAFHHQRPEWIEMERWEGLLAGRAQRLQGHEYADGTLMPPPLPERRKGKERK